MTSRLTEEARAAALIVVGDTEGATSIVARRLRADNEAQACASGRCYRHHLGPTPLTGLSPGRTSASTEPEREAIGAVGLAGGLGVSA